MWKSIKSFFSSTLGKALIKIGLVKYKEKNDNELTEAVTEVIEEVLDIDESKEA
jgi:hypothetical protein